MIVGESVYVLFKVDVGTNEMGEPIFEVQKQKVTGCLVRPVSDIAIADKSHKLYRDAKGALYRIAFPKTYKGKSLVGAKIALVERGYDLDDYNHALFVIGKPDITKPCPTKWNMLVDVGEIIGG